MARLHLIPPPEFAPPSIAGLSPVDRVQLWAQMVEEGDRLLYEGFLQRHGDATAARRAMQEWLDRRSADAVNAKVRMLAGRRPTGKPHGE
jgi:hypothetical protein